MWTLWILRAGLGVLKYSIFHLDHYIDAAKTQGHLCFQRHFNRNIWVTFSIWKKLTFQFSVYLQ